MRDVEMRTRVFCYGRMENSRDDNGKSLNVTCCNRKARSWRYYLLPSVAMVAQLVAPLVAVLRGSRTGGVRPNPPTGSSLPSLPYSLTKQHEFKMQSKRKKKQGNTLVKSNSEYMHQHTCWRCGAS